MNETTVMVLGGWGGRGPLDSTEVFNSYLSHRIKNSFSQIEKCTIISLKPVLLAPSCRMHGLTKLVLLLRLYIFIFVENWILYDTIHDFSL